MFLSPVHHSCFVVVVVVVFPQKHFSNFCPLTSLFPIFPAFHFNPSFFILLQSFPFDENLSFWNFWVCFLRSGFQDGWFLGAHYLKYHLEPTDGDTWLRGNEYVGSLNKCILLGPVWKCWGFGEHSAIIWLTSIQWKVNFHTECSKSEREKQILYINTYVWNLERWYWWTIYRAGIEMQR